MRRVVRTRVHAARLVIVQAEVAGGGFALHLCDLAARPGKIFDLDLERMHIDMSVGTVAGAHSATNTPILDGHLEAVLAPDRSHRTADHAKRRSEEHTSELQSLRH